MQQLKHTSKMTKVFLLFIGAFFTFNVFSQGIITGKVVSTETGEDLIGATVLLKGTTTGSMVDIDGHYRIAKVKAGSYQVICSYISFRSDTFDVVVKDGAIITHDFSLASSAMAIKMFTVEAKMVRSTENYMLKVKQKSASLMEGITAQEIAKRGDGNAADAAKRMTGITIEGGKYVYVRGLNDRYSKTTLNKAEIPGLDPNRNAVQMDLFPSNMIENMTVIKSFTPDLPGSFTGGLIDVETKDFPDAFTFQFSSALGYNTESSLNKHFLTYKSGASDNLGFDNGGRNIPSAALGKLPTLFVDNPRLEKVTKSFSKEMGPSATKSLLNQNYSISTGNQVKVFGKQFGFIVGLSYSKKYEHKETDARTGLYELTGDVNTTSTLNPVVTLADVKSNENVLWGILANASYKLSPNHKLGFTFVKDQNGIKGASFQQGEMPKDQPGLYYQTTALTYQQRSLTSYQVKGEHYFEGLKKLKIDWLGAYSKSRQKEPDLRYFSDDFTVNKTTGDTTFRISPSLYENPTRFYRDLVQTTKDVKVNFQFDVKENEGRKSIVKFGAAAIQQDRLVLENRFTYESQGQNLYHGSMTNYFSDNNMTLPTAGNPVANYIYVIDQTELRNNYRGNQSIYATYLMGDVWLFKKLRAISGARFETTSIQVASFDKKQKKGDLQEADILPALSLTYAASKNTNIRAAFSRTLARPTFREIAPFASYDFSANWIIVGNPDLQRSLINNFDLRYEMFPKMGEIISVGGFYKSFTNPIELVFNTKAQNNELTWRNINQATIYGAELEIKKNLNFISNSRNSFSLGGNVSYIYSEVTIDPQELQAIRASDPTASSTRPMFGQSPYILNVFFGYKNDSLGFSANVSYNVAGSKIALVVMGATPDVYSRPVNQLDFNINKNLGKHFKMNFKANNILNPIVKKTYNYQSVDYIFNSYKNGITFSLGIKYVVG